MKIDCSKLPVMKSHCATRPFKLNDKGHWQNARLADEVVSRTLFKSHQICHATEGKNRKPKNRCKGAFDHNMTIYERLGFKELVK